MAAFVLPSCHLRFFPFLAYLLGVPITIELPDLETQRSFNLARWKEILADPELAKFPYRIETDQYGRILMSPPPASRHGRRQMKIGALLLQLLPRGETISECPVSTAGGVRAVDVAWLGPDRVEIGQDPIVFVRAPDICIEILSPSNTASETDEKRALYFDAGASEVWICNLDGSMSFFSGVDHQLSSSLLCPSFPATIP